MAQKKAERVFSVELSSGNDRRRVSVPNGLRRLLIEGTIGALPLVAILCVTAVTSFVVNDSLKVALLGRYRGALA